MREEEWKFLVFREFFRVKRREKRRWCDTLKILYIYKVLFLKKKEIKEDLKGVVNPDCEPQNDANRQTFFVGMKGCEEDLYLLQNGNTAFTFSCGHLSFELVEFVEIQSSGESKGQLSSEQRRPQDTWTEGIGKCFDTYFRWVGLIGISSLIGRIFSLTKRKKLLEGKELFNETLETRQRVLHSKNANQDLRRLRDDELKDFFW